ncbi:MAG TPA: cobalamin-binding protein [Candidatus Acidoferrales bacterium]|nr:cobalamin-binding protein [Candidatus Acidoferrales bacterium]
MRVCSLLPAATEILFALGAGDSVFGVTHECDYPPEAATRPALIRPRIDVAASPAEIDRQVRERVERGESVYAVDASLLATIQPDLVVTQDLCHVCAASPDDLPAALARLAKPPQVVSLAPQRLADVWNDIRRLGALVGRAAEAEALAARLEARPGAVEAAGRAAPRPRVLALEWLDPPFVGGHWVPEMIELAGGVPLLASAGVPSVALDWAAVLATEPDVIVLMPCGYNLQRTLCEYSRSALPGGWRHLSAVRAGRVAAVDANSYFSRSGPRLADGVEILARILHPDLASAAIPPGSLEWISPVGPAH